MLKKNDSVESLTNMKNWKFCRTYDWIFENENILSKNTISDDKLAVIIMKSKLPKAKRHKRWRFIFNIKNHYNDNIDEIDLSAKIKFQKKWYYVFIKSYVMYENKKQHITINKKNPRTKIDDEFTRRFFCWKSQKAELKKNFEQFKTIIYETVDKKNSERFSRNSTDFSSAAEKFIKNNFKNKKAHFSHYKSGIMICMTNDLLVKDTSSFSKKQMTVQKSRRSIQKNGHRLYHINSEQVKSWSKADVNIFWHRNVAYRRFKESNESTLFAAVKKQIPRKSKKTIVKNKKSIDKNESKFKNFFKKLFDNAAAELIEFKKKRNVDKNKSFVKIDLFQKFMSEKNSWNEVETNEKIRKVHDFNIDQNWKKLKSITNTSKKKFRLFIFETTKFIEKNRNSNQRMFVQKFFHIVKNFVNYHKKFREREFLNRNFYFSSSIQFTIFHFSTFSYAFLFDQIESRTTFFYLRSKLMKHQLKSKIEQLRHMITKIDNIFERLTEETVSADAVEKWNKTIKNYAAVQTSSSWVWAFWSEKTVEGFLHKETFFTQKRSLFSRIM